MLLPNIHTLALFHDSFVAHTAEPASLRIICTRSTEAYIGRSLYTYADYQRPNSIMKGDSNSCTHYTHHSSCAYS